jgi:hypothetical protein
LEDSEEDGLLLRTQVMMMITMMMDYVSELRLPTKLLFVRQVIYEHGEPRWNNLDRGKLLILSTTALWQSYQQSNLVATGGTGEGNDEFGLAKYSCSYLQVIFYIT